MKREPKRYQCLNPDCGCISKKQRTHYVGRMGFATCYKCKGQVKEREEWLEWLNAERSKFYAHR